MYTPPMQSGGVIGLSAGGRQRIDAFLVEMCGLINTYVYLRPTKDIWNLVFAPDRPTDWRCCVGLLVGDNEDILCTLYCCVLNALNSQQHILHKLLPVLKLYIKDRTEEDIFELVNVLRSIQLIRNEVTRMTDWMTRIKSTWSITPTSNDAGHGIESGPNSELHSEFFKV